MEQFKNIGTFCNKCNQPFCICNSIENIENKMKKPIKSKLHFYSVCLKGLQEIAVENGYNLIILVINQDVTKSQYDRINQILKEE